ncbi:MAG: ATP-binding protein [Anaerolineae bacterium]
MLFRTMRWRIAVPYILLILLSMAALSLYLSERARSAYVSDLQARLVSQADWLAASFGDELARDGQPSSLSPLVEQYAGLIGARITIVAPDGTVLGDSEQDPATMDNHGLRAAVLAALARGQGMSIRFSRTLGYDMMYVAVRALAEDRVLGVVRVALPLERVSATVTQLRNPLVVAALLTSAVALLLAIFIAERMARPVRRLTSVVERFASGDLHARLFPSTRDEVGALTRSFNQMAETLRVNIGTLQSERARLAGVLEHMADGVLIADGDGHVSLINPAAARLLQTSAELVEGRPIGQVTRHHRIIGLWQAWQQTGAEQVELVELGKAGPFVQIIVTPLQGAEPGSALVMLQDLTRVRRLETVRRDFLSNISHELRTPLASLRALSETLHEGALEDPPAARHFLERIDTEVDAMTQMVQELLELSRIESRQAPLRLEAVPVADLVGPPMERLAPQAARANVSLRADLAAELPSVLADVAQIRQVMVNLLHNAIKFTPAGGSIVVAAQARDREVVVSVRDSGIGIAQEDLPRIFERFYKSDRARSGGGTGLGLAIANHIVRAHGGRIWAESVEGRGSTFLMALPLAPAEQS